MIRLVIIIIVSMWAFNIVMRTFNRKNGNPWKVFGSMDCGWTRKQVQELKNKSVQYEFLDCSSGECKEGMPTNILPDGTRRVGFTKVD